LFIVAVKVLPEIRIGERQGVSVVAPCLSCPGQLIFDGKINFGYIFPGGTLSAQPLIYN